MLPGIGIFGSDPVVKVLVPYLKGKGFRVEAIWAATLQGIIMINASLEVGKVPHVNSMYF
jgi:hypothetical protein